MAEGLAASMPVDANLQALYNQLNIPMTNEMRESTLAVQHN